LRPVARRITILRSNGFGPRSFTSGFEWLVHVVAHELEHVRQNRIGG
jgi:hypothetical protein